MEPEPQRHPAETGDLLDVRKRLLTRGPGACPSVITRFEWGQRKTDALDPRRFDKGHVDPNGGVTSEAQAFVRREGSP